jgi:hypothetical protein
MQKNTSTANNRIKINHLADYNHLNCVLIYIKIIYLADCNK